MDNIVFVMLASVISIIILYSLIQGYFEGVTAFKYNSDLNVRQQEITVNKPTSKNFAYGMWININKLAATDVTIFSRLGEITLFVKNGTLMIQPNFEVMRNFPLQQWVYITISVKGQNEEDDKTKKDEITKSIIDAYIDGKLVRSFESISVISPTESNSQLTLGPFDAKLIGFKRWVEPLTPSMVSDEYNAANMKKMLGSYNLDISILKNEVLAKRFSVF